MLIIKSSINNQSTTNEKMGIEDKLWDVREELYSFLRGDKKGEYLYCPQVKSICAPILMFWVTEMRDDIDLS